MRALGDRLFGLCCLGLALACACSVFPDSAVLPISEGQGGAAGEPSQDGGAPVADAGEGGSSTASGGSALGGSGSGSSGASGAGSGGVNVAEAGAAGQDTGGTGGTGTTCAAPRFVSLPVSADLWIGSAAPDDPHEGEALVYVSGGSDQRRTLLGLDLPATPSGAVLLKAELVLPLVANADATKAERTLALYLLLKTPDPKKTSWTHYGAGNNRQWDELGGDLAVDALAEAQIAKGMTSGRVAFEITAATRAALKPDAYSVPVVILESGSAPAAPAALAFTSLEGNASGSATLELTYCAP